MATLSWVLVTEIEGGKKELGRKMTLVTNRASASYTHTITYSWAGRTGTIATNVGDSCTWTPSIANMAPHLPNGTSAVCTFTCYTYENGKLLGSQTSTMTLSIPDSVKPTISSVTVSDSQGYDDIYGGFVSGKSQLNVSVNASGAYGSTITKYTGYAGSRPSGDVTTSARPSFTLPALNYESGNVTLTTSVIDSRGRQVYNRKTITVYPYTFPSLSGTTVERWNTSTNQPDDESSTAKVTVVSNICDVGNKNLNRATITVRYKLSTSSTWTTYATRTNQGISTSFTVYIPNLDENLRYNIDVVCTDSFRSEVHYSNQGVDSASPVIDLKSNGSGIAFLAISENDGVTIGDDVYLSKANDEATEIYKTSQTGTNDLVMSISRSSITVPVRLTGVSSINSNVGFYTSGYLQVSGDSAFNGEAIFSGYTRIPAITVSTVIGGTQLLTGSNAVIPMTSELSNSGVQCFDLMSRGVYCKHSGYVKVSYSIQVYGLAADQNVGANVTKNGVVDEKASWVMPSPNNGVTITASAILMNVNAGDIIRLQARSTGGGGTVNRAILNVSY